MGASKKNSQKRSSASRRRHKRRKGNTSEPSAGYHHGEQSSIEHPVDNTVDKTGSSKKLQKTKPSRHIRKDGKSKKHGNRVDPRKCNNSTSRSTENNHLEEEPDLMLGIEEQLQRQREQQKEQKKLREKRQASESESNLPNKNDDNEKEQRKPPKELGNYRYDPQRQAFFPMKDHIDTYGSNGKGDQNHDRTEAAMQTSKSNLSSHGLNSSQNRNWRTTPTQTYLVETCPSSYRRTLLKDAIAGRCVFHSATVPSQSSKRDGTREQALPPEELQKDLVCKSLLHPSCRTFDVRENPITSRPIVATICRQDEIVCRNSLLGCRTSTRYGFLDDKCISLRHLTLPNTITNNRNGTPEIYTGCLSYQSSFSAAYTRTADFATFRLLNFDQEHYGSSFQFGIDLNHGFDLPNDFTVCGDETIMFAPSLKHRSGGANFFTINLGGGGSMSRNSVQRAGLPSSDVFCMEAANSNTSFATKKCVAMGHRNGTLSIWDTISNRASTRTTLSPNQSSSSFGSATSLIWLPNGHEILARGSMGDCHLYDVRRMGSASGVDESSSGKKRADPSLLRILPLPHTSEDVRSKIALYCNGIITDPTQTVVIAPLLTRSEEPSLGFWSLRTGQWIGQKQLTPSSAFSQNSMSGTNEKPPPFLELCQTSTPVFTTAEDDGGMIRDNKDKNRFGIWFKCGRSVSPTPTDGTPTKALRTGNIYHMTLSGAHCPQV